MNLTVAGFDFSEPLPSVIIHLVIYRTNGAGKSHVMRADEYRQRAAGAKRHAAQLRDLFMKNAYEQMARDRLTLAEQVEWIDSIKEPSRRKPKE